MALPEMETDTASSDRARIIQAATIVGAAFVVSRILGIVRDAVINFYYNIDSLEANAYFIANRFPELIFLIIAGGALGSAFIPIFSGYFVRDDARGGWRLFSAIVNLITLVTTIVAGIAFVLTPLIVDLFYPDLVAGNPALRDMTIELMRVMLVTPIIFGISGVVMAALNARQHFLLPAIAPIIYNLGIIGGAIILAPNVMGLAIGAIFGALGHLAIQIPGLFIKHAHYTPILSVKDQGVRQVLWLMLPRVLGLSFGQFNHLILQFMAQSMALGSIPALGFSWRIMIMPQAIIGQALGIAAFPTFATLAAENALDKMRSILVDMLRLILFLSLPATMLLVVLRRPMVSFLFERGQFDEQSTSFVAWALLFFALSLVALATIEIISRAFFALEDTWTPVIVGALQLVAMWLIGFWLAENIFPELGFLQLGGLALGYSISTLIELGVLLFLVNRKLNGLDNRRLLDGFWRMALATIFMGIICWFVLDRLADLASLWQLVVVGIVALLSYLLASIALHVTELNQLIRQIQQRLVKR